MSIYNLLFQFNESMTKEVNESIIYITTQNQTREPRSNDKRIVEVVGEINNNLKTSEILSLSLRWLHIL